MKETNRPDESLGIGAGALSDTPDNSLSTPILREVNTGSASVLSYSPKLTKQHRVNIDTKTLLKTDEVKLHLEDKTRRQNTLPKVENKLFLERKARKRTNVNKMQNSQETPFTENYHKQNARDQILRTKIKI